LIVSHAAFLPVASTITSEFLIPHVLQF